METSPRRLLALIVLSLATLACLGGGLFGIMRLTQAGLSLSLLIWFSLPLFGFPLAAVSGYYLYGLGTARYRLDRDGFALRWGLAFEQAPLRHVKGVVLVEDLDHPLELPLLKRLFGSGGGWISIPGRGLVEIFGTGNLRDGVLVDLGEKLLLVTPRDQAEFLEAFRTSTRQGSLEDLSPQCWRPDLVIGEVWQDRAARAIMLLGAALPLSMVVYLSLRAGSIPAQVPFGFDAGGELGPLVPAGRLLLFPMITMFVWLLDALIGVFLYRSPPGRAISYSVWSAGILTSGLLWVAIVQMLSPT